MAEQELGGMLLTLCLDPVHDADRSLNATQSMDDVTSSRKEAV